MNHRRRHRRRRLHLRLHRRHRSDPPEPVSSYDCKGKKHDTQAAADAVNCDPKYTACDGSEHSTQAAANAVDCSQQFQQQILHDLSCEGTVDGTTGQCDNLFINP